MSAPEKPVVGIVMGSDSDYPILEPCFQTLRDFGVPFSIEICSAHRTPEKAALFAGGAREAGYKVLIAAAGGAAHLAGAIAANTTLPVIGLPCPSTLNGLDSLLSTVQMPAGIPVATVAIGSAGATNAALLAIQILALSDSSLESKLSDHRKKMAGKIAAKNEEMRRKLADA
ncbi:MAG: 5-(carboxyamino)imidazole ribonucleotide mutase [Candidatus Brocadiia bacterium]